MPAPDNYQGFRLGYGDSSNSPVAEFIVGSSARAMHIAEAADADTDWNVSANTHPTVYIHSATCPATNHMSMSHDGTNGTILMTGGNYVIDTDSTNQIIFSLGGAQSFNFHDVSGVSFVAATAVAGHDNYWQAQDGGVGCSATVGGVGGLLNFQTGDGGAGFSTNDRAGGAGGALTIATGAGGATASSGSGATGAGGAMTIQPGTGGAVLTGATGAPGVGGALTISGGTGGTTAVNCDTAGAGATITIEGGKGGNVAANSTTAGAGGSLILRAGAGGDETSGTTTTGGVAGNLCLRLGAVGCGDTNGAVGKLRLLNTGGTDIFLAVAACEPGAAKGVVWVWAGACTAVAPTGSGFLMIVDDGTV